MNATHENLVFVRQHEFFFSFSFVTDLNGNTKRSTLGLKIINEMRGYATRPGLNSTKLKQL